MLSHAILSSTPISVLLLLSLVGSAFSLCDRANACTDAASPCCSAAGFCGATKEYCGPGCNPLASLAGACAPNPVCRPFSIDIPSALGGNAATTAAIDIPRLQLTTNAWNGDAEAYDAYLQTGTVSLSDDRSALVLKQTPPDAQNVEGHGAVISSTRYMLYGSFAAVLKTTNQPGVITAAIGMSDIKDEVCSHHPYLSCR